MTQEIVKAYIHRVNQSLLESKHSPNLSISVRLVEMQGDLQNMVKRGKPTKEINVPINIAHHAEREFVRIDGLRVVTPLNIEKHLIHTITRTPFEGNFVIKSGRYFFHFEHLGVSSLRTLLNFIVSSTGEKLNYSWVEPLQNILLEVQFAKLKRTKKKVGYPPSDEDYPTAQSHSYFAPSVKPKLYSGKKIAPQGWTPTTSLAALTNLNAQPQLIDPFDD